jgi:hypothetical protein
VKPSYYSTATRTVGPTVATTSSTRHSRRLLKSLNDLLEDNRRPDIVRHLRRAYRDPLTGGELALIREPDTQGIVGFHSPATGRPFKGAGFVTEDAGLSEATRYDEWRFVFVAPVKQVAPEDLARIRRSQ